MKNKWLTTDWYKYIFRKSEYDNGCPWYKRIWCRINNHPAGCIYYSTGFEPDWHCKTCGDEI